MERFNYWISNQTKVKKLLALFLVFFFPLQVFGAVTFAESGTDGTQGFNLYAGAPFTSGTGTFTSVTDRQHTGPRSMKAVDAAANDNANAQSPDGVVADAGGRVCFWLNTSQATPSVATSLLSVRNSGGSFNYALGVSTSNKVVLQILGASAKTGTVTIAISTWYEICVTQVITSSASYTVKVFVNGTLDVTGTQADGNMTNTVSTRFHLGPQTNGAISSFTATSAGTWWFDDVYSDNSAANTDPGLVLVTAKRPFSNGTANAFTTRQLGTTDSGYGTGHAPKVNERPIADNGWGVLNTAVATEEYNIEGQSVGDVDITGRTIVGYMGWIRARVDSTSNTPVHHIIINNVATTKTMSTATSTFEQLVTSATFPAGTGTDIGMDAQYTTTAHNTNFTESGLEFAYLQASTTASTTITPRIWLFTLLKLTTLLKI